MAISLAGHWTTDQSTTLSVSPVNVGDLMVFAAATNSNSSYMTGISGGGTSWQGSALVSQVDGNIGYAQLWWGTVVTAGASTITVTQTGNRSYPWAMGSYEWAAGSVTWAVDGSQHGGQNSDSTSTITWKSLTPGGTGELYFGVAYGTTPSAGSTSGFTYDTGLASYGTIVCYDASVSTAAQPTATQAGSYAASAAALFVATTTILRPVAPCTPYSQAVNRSVAF